MGKKNEKLQRVAKYVGPPSISRAIACQLQRGISFFWKISAQISWVKDTYEERPLGYFLHKAREGDQQTYLHTQGDLSLLQ